jgi:hypothetical protein
MVMDALIIKKQHLDKILAGRKTWEIRGSKTHKRGKIGLIQSGSSTIVGECELIDCKKLSENDFIKNLSKHQVEPERLKEVVGHYKTPYAWVLKNAKRYSKPIKYQHPNGAIIWVKVP